jgi:TAG lipase / steryl ester hydrolase / phospholipase A2 / LPA acyltransferase
MRRGTTIRSLKRDLEEAPDYATWRELSEALDELEGGTAWRAEDASTHYDAGALRDSLHTLERLTRDGPPLALVDALKTGLYQYQLTLSDPLLFRHARVGTKHLVARYLDAVEAAMNHLCDTEIPGMDRATKLVTFSGQANNVGASALLLSGGATLGLFHIGVVKALFEQGLLPQIVSGASTGSMIAGGLCTRTDAELADVLSDPASFIDTRVFRLAGLSQMRDDHALMAGDQLLQAIEGNMRADTFLESYERTGRILCMSVSPTRARQKPRLLCYTTAPDVLVTSASLASCAIPGLFSPTALMRRRGEVVSEAVPGERWSDGSVEGDLPTERLARLLGVNYTIVSQTNPHVLAFTRAKVRDGALPVVTDLVSSSLAAQGFQLLSVARRHTRRPGLRRLLDRAHSIADQRYLGDITLAPKLTAWNYGIALRNASGDDLMRLIRQGERATWPNLAMIDAGTRVSRTLHACVARLKAPDAPAA